MYKVLVVDEARAIREGIVKLIDWNTLGLELIGAKENGREALEIINIEKPEIVITDIIMPEMNGLELISEVKAQNLNVNFIILSRYDEFNYASTALKYGVKDYILKPCDEIDITKALEKVMEEIYHKQKKEQLMRSMSDKWQEAMQQMKEKFLVEAIEMGNFINYDYNRLRKTFELTDANYKLILLRPEKECSIIERFALKNISEELLMTSGLETSTIYCGDLLLLIRRLANSELETPLEDVQEVFLQYYNIKIFIAISEESPLEELQSQYADILDCLRYGFNIGEGQVITKQEVTLDNGVVEKEWEKRYINKLVISIKTGQIDAVKEQIKYFFKMLSNGKERIKHTKIYCTVLILNLIQQCQYDELEEYAQAIVKLDEMNTIQQIEQYVMEAGVKIAELNYSYTRKYSKVVEKVISYIDEELDNPNMSLKKIAKEVLFMNEDYLSRLFQRETGERFSQYVNKLRMEKAKYLIVVRSDLKMFEISKLAGFGDKNQYFSLVFKKYTGMSPTEYKNLFNIDKNEHISYV